MVPRLSRPSKESIVSEASSFGSFDSESGSTESGASGDSIAHKTHLARLPYSRTAPPKNRWDIMSTFVICGMLLGSVALIMEGIAYNADQTWNSILYGDEALPELEGHSSIYFKDRMINLDTSQSEMESVRRLMLRDGDHEPVAICLITIFLIILAVTLLLSSQSQLNQNVLGVTLGIGGFLTLVSGILILVSDLNVDSAHREAAKELRAYVKRLAHSYAFIPPENIALVQRQAANLALIEDACALSQSRNGRYSALYSNVHITISTKEVFTVKDLRTLGFCSYESVKFAAFVVCFLFSILCAVIPILIYYRGHGKFQRGKVVPLHSVRSKNNMFNVSKVPPAYGYGLPSMYGQVSSNLDVAYDPRFPPVAPTADLAILKPDRKSQSQPQQKKLSDNVKYKRYHEGSFDDDLEPSISFDSFEPQMFASIDDLPKSKKQPQKNIIFDESESESESIMSNTPRKSPPLSAPRKTPPSAPRKTPPSAPRKTPPPPPKEDDSEYSIDESMAESSNVPHSRAPPPLHHDLPDLPGVPKKTNAAKKEGYVYQSPYTVHKY